MGLSWDAETGNFTFCRSKQTNFLASVESSPLWAHCFILSIFGPVYPFSQRHYVPGKFNPSDDGRSGLPILKRFCQSVVGGHGQNSCIMMMTNGQSWRSPKFRRRSKIREETSLLKYIQLGNACVVLVEVAKMCFMAQPTISSNSAHITLNELQNSARLIVKFVQKESFVMSFEIEQED